MGVIKDIYDVFLDKPQKDLATSKVICSKCHNSATLFINGYIICNNCGVMNVLKNKKSS